jgi:uncharacterized delta-60 repeat protein
LFTQPGCEGVALRLRLVLAFLIAACAVAAAGAGAAGTDSTLTESLGVHYEKTGFSSVLAGPDGSLVAVGSQRIERFGADGSAAGDAFPAAPPEAKLFPAAGGKTFVLGYRKLMRLNPDGSVDTTFGGDGAVAAGYGQQAIAELGSGRIALVSTVVEGAKNVYAYVEVELLNQDGSVLKGAGLSTSLSASFVPLGGRVGVPEISPTADGGALVVGENFLLELNADGSANGAFGKGGLVDEVPGLIGGHALPDGSVEAVARESGSRGPTLLRYTAAGRPDPAFGTQGVRHFELGDGEVEPKVALWGADGSLIVGGDALAGSCSEGRCEETPILVAFDAAGELEAGFAQGGALRLTGLAGSGRGYWGAGVTAIARRPDGSIAAAGSSPPEETVGFLAAVSPQGALLSGFGEGGIVRVPAPRPAQQELVGFVPLPDGSLLAAGTTDVGIQDQPVLIRYRADRGLDRSFGDGAGYVALGAPKDHGSTAKGFAVDGEDVLVAVPELPHGHLLMARAADGEPVASFGSGGDVELPSEVLPTQVAFADDGNPLVLGTQTIAGPFWAEPGVVLRYRPDGSPDTAFGHRGRFTMRLGHRAVQGRALLTGPGGRLLVGGSIGHRFAIAGLRPDGSLDPRFGSGGWSIVNLGESAHQLTLARVGSHIYLAGTYGDGNGEADLVLMRFDDKGHLDKSFGRDGRRVAPLKFSARPTKIVPTPQGVLVVLGGGPQPLVTFTRAGKVRRGPVGPRPQFVDNVRAAVSGSSLILGWTTYSHALKRTLYHLATRPLARP